jgi:7-cyano-7-deazaguanine synthase
MKKAVVLLSGGLDSATALYWARARGYQCSCLIFDYGQRHRKEIQCARKIAAAAKSKAVVLPIQFPWKGSALTDRKIRIPKNALGKTKIPATYVPARNTVFLSFAAACAETVGAHAIVIGANAVDFSGYPDCRPAYYRAMRNAIRKGTKTGVEGKSITILTPLIQKTKPQIIRLGIRLGVPYRLTWSCYQGGKSPCGLCDSCLIRADGFRRAGFLDPAIERKKS